MRIRNLGILAAVLACFALWAREAPAQTVSVHVVQVRASNEGGESVDPSLLGLGERLKRQYPYRNFKHVGADTQSGAAGADLRFNLSGERLLTLNVSGVAADQIAMRAVVAKGRENVVNTSLKVKSGHTFLIAVPLGNDKLILAITPTVAR